MTFVPVYQLLIIILLHLTEQFLQYTRTAPNTLQHNVWRYKLLNNPFSIMLTLTVTVLCVALQQTRPSADDHATENLSTNKYYVFSNAVSIIEV